MKTNKGRVRVYIFWLNVMASHCALYCQASLAHFKASNLQRHFSPLHANITRVKKPKNEGSLLKKKNLSDIEISPHVNDNLKQMVLVL